MKPHTQDITRLVVHHSATSVDDTTVDDIRKWHVIDNGWDAIGYHWVITGLGILHYTRPITMQGAHAKGFNNGSLGVCLIGNNEEQENRWRREQLYALHSLWLAISRVIKDLDVYGHRDITDRTVCPGIDIRPLLLGPRYQEV